MRASAVHSMESAPSQKRGRHASKARKSAGLFSFFSFQFSSELRKCLFFSHRSRLRKISSLLRKINTAAITTITPAPIFAQSCQVRDARLKHRTFTHI